MTRHLATLRNTGLLALAFPPEPPPAGLGLQALILPAPLRVGLARSLSRLQEPTDRLARVTRVCMDRSMRTPLEINPLLGTLAYRLAIAVGVSEGLPRTSWSCQALLLQSEKPTILQIVAQALTRWHKPVSHTGPTYPLPVLG
jgi:hypothetical protein